MARREHARRRAAWVGDLPVYERVLDNGLKALVLPRPHAPIVVCDLYYPAGSVDEPAGLSGLAHFVEHMLFKGTSWLPKGQIDRLSFLAAGQSNAETGEDCTHYWFAFPRDRWDLALSVEADRMMNACFEPLEVEAERQVIEEERARELDSPLGRLDQTHLAMSYLVHPYRNPILGWPEDVRRITEADLRGFYQSYYRPDGAVLVVVGDLDPEQALERIEAEFGGLRATVELPSRLLVDEPPQVGRRDFALIETDVVMRGLLGWRSVARGHADNSALGVLGDVMSCGRRSRLWNRLVESDRLATWVDCAQEGSRLSGQFLLQLESGTDGDPERIEAAIRDEVEKLATDGPTADELKRSRHRLEAAWRWEQEDIGGLAAGLGQVALWGDWREWQEEHRSALAVTGEEIQRAAAQYLVESRLTVGWSLPRPDKKAVVVTIPTTRLERTAPLPTGEEPLAVVVPVGLSTLSDYNPKRKVLGNGLRFVTERRPGTGTVAIEFYCDSGQLREARPGLSYLAGRMLEEGTEGRSGDEMAEAIEDVGGVLEVGSTGMSLRVRAEDLALAVELLADLILRPTFPKEALGWAKRRTIAELQGDLDDPAYRAELIFRKLTYGEHPCGRDPRGTPREIRVLEREDLVAHHERCYQPGRSALVVVGDFESRALKTLVERHLGDWRGHERHPEPFPWPEKPLARRTRRVYRAGEQVHLLMGHLGIARNDPDHDALAILDHILGSGPGFTDRLSRRLRDELGLAYAVHGGITDSADVVPGLFRVYVGTGPEEADRAVAAAMEEIRAMREGLFSDEEVERSRLYLAGSWVFEFQTVGQRAERLLDLERWGLPLEEPLRWPERILHVTTRQVRAAAKRHLHPDKLVRVEYGPVLQRSR